MKYPRVTRSIAMLLVSLLLMLLWPQSNLALAGVPDESPMMTRTIAVIDFSNDTGDAKLEHLKKGLSESLITKLAGYRELKIVERSKLDAALKELGFGQTLYADSSTAAQIGKVVGANTIVSGSLVKAGNRFEMNVRVFDVETSRILVSEGYGFQSENETLDVVKYLSMRIPHEFGIRVDIDAYSKTKQMLDARMSGGNPMGGDNGWIIWAVVGGVAVVGVVILAVTLGGAKQTVNQVTNVGSSNPAKDALPLNVPLLQF